MKRAKGFTLLELMIVIAIIGILIAIVIPDLLKTRQEAEIAASVASLRGVQSALELYYTHYKYYPDSLQTLILDGYLQDGGDRDPWNTPFRYKLTSGTGASDNSGDSNSAATNYLLGSCGPDMKPDTDDDIDPPINPNRHSFRTAGTNEQLGATSGGEGGGSTGN